MIFISFWGQWFVCLFVAALLFVLPGTRKAIGIPILFAVFFAVALGYVLKRVIAIPRPEVFALIEASGYGHPSGHTMRATAFFGMCAVLVWRRTSKKSLKAAAFILAVFLSCLMGFSRIYLGVHTATDTVAAYLAGIVVLLFCFMVLQRFSFWQSKDICQDIR